MTKPQSITIGISAAAEMLGVSISSLDRSRRTGILRNLPAPPPEMTMDGSVKRVLYRLDDLEQWQTEFTRRRQTRTTKPVNASVMTFSYRNGGEPLLASVRHRTFLRSISLTNLLCVRWCHDRTADGRILLMANVQLPDNDAGHCHLTDDTQAAISMAAEDLVLTLWKAVRANAEKAAVIAEAARSVSDME